MPRTWRFTPHDAGRVAYLADQLEVSPLTAQILIARGLDQPERARAFLLGTLHDLHPPESLGGVPAAVERLVAAIRAERPIIIYGDYDADGVTSTALLWHCLKLLGARVDYSIPCRLAEGYGINEQRLTKLHEEHPDGLVVSVDCGITSIAEAALARRLGLELIITDHHTPEQELPDAAAIVHPRLPPGAYPFGDLCGVGVAFKLAWALCKAMHDGQVASERMRGFLTDAIALAAIGTVADCVPLLGENRLIVSYGLRALATRSGPGLEALLRSAGIDPGQIPGAEAIGFGVGPRLNAAGRLGQAALAVELLTTGDLERAVELADYLDRLNKQRRSLERRIVKEAKEQIADHPEWAESEAFVLASHDWHPGVIGIAAGRIAEHFERPAVMIALDPASGQGQGSARSFAGYDLYQGLDACREHLIGFGGHQAAAGLRIAETQIEAFRAALCRHRAVARGGEETIVELDVDAEVRLRDVTFAAVGELDRLGPFGQKNPPPALVATGVELAAPPRLVGEGGRTLLLRLRQRNSQPLKAIAFGRSGWAEPLERAGQFDIHFTAAINTFNGRRSVELRLVDWQRSQDSGSVGE